MKLKERVGQIANTSERQVEKLFECSRCNKVGDGQATITEVRVGKILLSRKRTEWKITPQRKTAESCNHLWYQAGI